MLTLLVMAKMAGSLIVIGGGSEPASAIKQLIADAGGPSAKIVILSHPHQEVAPSAAKLTKFFAEQGAQNLAAPVELEPAALVKSLADANGVYLSGGDQILFMSRFPEASGVPAAIRAVYARGGVIGGSSAGASLIGEWMPTGEDGEETALKPNDKATAKGLAVWPGVRVDQHFFRRARYRRLLLASVTQPDVLGVGIDEKAWIEVKGGRLTAFDGQTMVIKTKKGADAGPLSNGELQIRILNPGESYRLPR